MKKTYLCMLPDFILFNILFNILFFILSNTIIINISFASSNIKNNTNTNTNINKNNISISMPSINSNNFHDSQQAINIFLKNFDTLPKGWKQLKRIEAFWENKRFSDKKTSSAKFILSELKKFNIANKQHKPFESQQKLLDKNLVGNFDTIKWEELGPSLALTDTDGIYMPKGNGRINCIVESPIDENIIFVGSASGGIWKTTDAGNTWNVIPTTDIISLGILDIVISKTNPNIMYATTGDASGWHLFKSFSVGIMKSTDAGNTWNLVGETYNLADSAYCSRIQINPQNENIVFVATTKGIIKTTNGGENWEYVLPGYNCRDIKLNPANSNIIYATTFGYEGPNFIFVSEDAGENWYITKTFEDAVRIELAVTPANPELVYALAGHKDINKGMEGLYVSRSNGLMWDTIMHHTKEESYINLTYRQNFYNLCISVSPINEKELFVGGVHCYFSNNGGESWKYILDNMHVDIHRFTYNKDASKIYCANDGGINYAYINQVNKDSTGIWNNITDGLNITQYYRIGAHPYSSKYLLAGSQDNGSHLKEKNIWTCISGGDGMECMFHPTRVGEIFVTSQYGSQINYNIPDKFTWITEFVINPLVPDTMLICGTDVWVRNLNTSDTILVSKISNFEKKDNNNDLRAIQTSNINKNYIYTSSTNRLYATKNYGESWEELYNSDATIVSIAISNINPDIIWTAHSGHFSNEKVMQFTNGEIENLSYNLPNVSINSIEFYPKENRLFIGTDIGIFTLDLQDTVWEWFNTNMPNVCINELEYVSTTGYLYAATWGRGIWRCQLHNCNCDTNYTNDTINNSNYEPQLNLSGNYELCDPNIETMPLTVINKLENYTYFWSNGSAADTIYTSIGDYYAVAIAPNGCSCISEKCTISYKDTNMLSKPNVYALSRNPVCVGYTAKYYSNISSKNAVDSFHWSNGCTKDTAEYSINNQPVVLYINYKSGCRDTIVVDTIKYYPVQEKPVLIKEGADLVCQTDAYSYIWYRDADLLKNNITKYCRITEPGNYVVYTVDTNFCTMRSNELSINFDENENDKFIKVKVTPNPNSGIFTLEMYYSDKTIANISVFDAIGREIITLKNELINKYYYCDIDMSTYANGTYFIKISSLDYTRMHSFIITR